MYQKHTKTNKIQKTQWEKSEIHLDLLLCYPEMVLENTQKCLPLPHILPRYKFAMVNNVTIKNCSP